MYDAITFGSATRDIFVRSAAFDTRESEDSPTGIEGCFPLGSKIEIDDLVFETGGGSTNAAVTFGRLGHKTAALTAIGDDSSGLDVIRALEKDGVSAELIQKAKGWQTAHSIIILAGSGERTVIVFRGASEKISVKKIDWPRLQAGWFYVSSLGGNIDLMQRILFQAKRIGAKVAWNPGAKELKYGFQHLSPLARQTDIFNLNVEEAMLLLNTTKRDVSTLVNSLRKLPRRSAIVTDGLNGAFASDGRRVWHSDIIDVPRVNVTGAGDAFGSGLVAGLMRKDDLRYALAVGTWNATGVVQKMGAKKGIIKRYPSVTAVKKIKITVWK